MNPNEINRRIAKLLGCTMDYTGDLNACRSFERPMSIRDQNLYAWTIRNLKPSGMDDFQIITATPEQRCEAFLRMKGEWNEK